MQPLYAAPLFQPQQAVAPCNDATHPREVKIVIHFVLADGIGQPHMKNNIGSELILSLT